MTECTSRPSRPCDFCCRFREKHTTCRSEKDNENQFAEDFLRSYSERQK